MVLQCSPTTGLSAKHRVHIPKHQFVINGAHTSVISLIAPLYCARVGHSKRQLYGKGRKSSVSDVNAGYIYCTNNQYNLTLS